MPVTKTPAERLEYTQAKSQARTAVYAIAFGPAKSGRGLSDPLLDHRVPPEYGVLEFNQVSVHFGHYLPLCRFAEDRRTAVVAKFNSLCPKGAQRFVDMDRAHLLDVDSSLLACAEVATEIREARNIGDGAATEIREAFAAEIEAVAAPQADCLGELPVGYGNKPEPVEAETPAPKKRGRPKKMLLINKGFFGMVDAPEAEPVPVEKKAPRPKKLTTNGLVAL